MKIDLSGPDITQAEIDAVVHVLKSGRLSLGPKLTAFEEAVARYVGVRRAVAVSSGTTGLHLLVRAMGIGPGDEVITTPFSFIASANCILFENARPVFADIDPDTWNIDPARIEAAVTSKTKAIIPVNVFGQVADMDRIREIATRHNLRIIEDACESLGARYKGRMAGTLGDAGLFAFYPNKQITTGEGGMIVTDDDEIARLCDSLRNQGRDTGMGWLSHERLGYNYRLSDIACALGLVQIGRIQEILAKRARVAQWYRQRLTDEPRVRMQKISGDCEISWFVFVVRLADDTTADDRARIITQLRAKGIGCNNYFAPIHLQAFYRRAFGYKEGDFPICEQTAARTIALPFYSNLAEAEVDTVCAAFKALL